MPRPLEDRSLVLLVICTALYGTCTVGFAVMIWRDVRLDLAGETAVGEVIETEHIERGRRSMNSSYIVRYRFRAEGVTADAIEAEAGVTRPVWEEARRSRQIGVSYLRSNPGVNRPKEHTILEGSACPAVAGGLTGFLTAGACYEIMCRLRDRRRRANANAAQGLAEGDQLGGLGGG